MREPARPDDRSNRRRRASLGALWAATSLLALAGVPASASETLRFQVYLDRDPIGEHSFQIAPSPSGQQVLSQARFDVNILVFNAFRYRHESRELWRDGCLERIRSNTDENGKSFQVAGERVADTLSLNVNGDAQRVPGCVATFAYWDPSLLKKTRLLNPQTGELVAARLESEGWESRVMQGRTVQARRYRLRADRLDISLWYTQDGAWIGLESDTGKGRTLRYERL